MLKEDLIQNYLPLFEKFGFLLSQKEQIVAKARLVDRKSLKEVGKEIGVIGERIRMRQWHIFTKLEFFGKHKVYEEYVQKHLRGEKVDLAIY